jgi:hypothetical protein
MVISNIYGGLGNQMFQYAVGRAYALRTNKELKIDISSFEEYSLREFKLDDFNLSYTQASLDEINHYKFGKYSAVNRFTKKEFNRFIFKNDLFRKEKFYHFDPQLLESKGDVYLLGYWQSEKYFADFKDVLLSDFTLKKTLSDAACYFHKSINLTNSVSLHVRRGDYLSNPKANYFHGILPIQFYKKAVELLLSHYSNLKFFIFSDDLKWCKENLNFVPDSVFVVLEETANDCEEMYLMSQCKHNIIANSTFSWWGAWLNQHPEKHVIAPESWFSDKAINTSDLIPFSWIRV